MTEIELLEHVLGNRKAGKHYEDGLLYRGFKEGCIAETLDGVAWHKPENYTLAPRTHTVNTFEVPAPERDKLKPGYIYYVPYHYISKRYDEVAWAGSEIDFRLLTNNQVFLTKEAAILNQKAQAGIDPYGDDE